MELNQLPLKKGEKEFFEHFEKHPHFETLRKEEVKEKEAKERIKEFIKNLTEEIQNIPQLQIESEIHKKDLGEVSNILAKGVYLSLEEGLLEGLNFIKSLNNPFLLDALHDLLAGHFFESLLKHNKIKIIR